MLQSLLRDARVLVANLDVDVLAGAAGSRARDGFAELERLAAAGKVLATGRLVASGSGPGDDSFRDVDAWLASVSGTTLGAARATTKAATRSPRAAGGGVGRPGRASLRRAGRAGDHRGRGRRRCGAAPRGPRLVRRGEGAPRRVRPGDRGRGVEGAGAGDGRARPLATDAAAHGPWRQRHDHHDRPTRANGGGDGLVGAVRAGDLLRQPAPPHPRAPRSDRVRRHGRARRVGEVARPPRLPRPVDRSPPSTCTCRRRRTGVATPNRARSARSRVPDPSRSAPRGGSRRTRS